MTNKKNYNALARDSIVKINRRSIRNYEEKEKRIKRRELERASKPINTRIILNNRTYVPSIEEIRNTYKGRKPKILAVSDVRNWAWWIKSEYLQKYLSDEFEIDIVAITEDKNGIKSGYDLYLTYGYSFINQLRVVPYYKRISGVTAHRETTSIKDSLLLAYAVHANSMMLLDQINTFHRNTFYVPNGVDEKMFFCKRKPISDSVIFGHIGKLTPVKGQKKYIEPAVKVANAKYFSHYNTHLNKIPHCQMPDIHQNYDVFIVASDEDGTPNPALEAAACGRPIISNRIGNMPEFIKDGYNGFLVEKDINAYVEKINWFKEHPEKVVEMGMNARKTIEEGWTWKIQTENYRRMFKTLLGMK